MILNKKGLAVLPLVALLFASCSPWKGISYDKAKEFIDTNYKVDGAKELLPTKVHEKFSATAANTESGLLVGFMALEFFYSTNTYVKIDWTKSPYTYEGDYEPAYGDARFLPILSEFNETLDCLVPSDEKAGTTVTYEVNGKQFKQNITMKDSSINMSQTGNFLYNDRGYRVELHVKGSEKFEGEQEGVKVNIEYNFEYSATYTYAE